MFPAVEHVDKVTHTIHRVIHRLNGLIRWGPPLIHRIHRTDDDDDDF
jgi:hypothetical protein